MASERQAPLNQRVNADDFVALLRALRRARPDGVTTTLLAARVNDAGVLQLHLRLLVGPQPGEAEAASLPDYRKK